MVAAAAGVGAAGKPPVARRTPQTFLKRQREQKRAEKARQKQAKREARKLDAPDGEAPLDSGDELEDTADDSIAEGFAPAE